MARLKVRSTEATPPQGLLRRVPLRARVIVAFTLGATVAALVLVISTYGLTRSEILQQRQSASSAQFFANARQVQASLRSEDTDFNVLLESLPSEAGSRSIVRTGPQTWWSPSLSPADLPVAIISATATQPDALMLRYRDPQGTPLLSFGLALRPGETSRLDEVSYFEVVPLADIAATLDTLRWILGGGAAATVLIGLAIGIWASRRFLRPLGDLAAAASSISQGKLDTRVTDSQDPDLAPIVASFNDMAASLERRVERDARFASDVSHELRSPLQTLRSSISVLENRRAELSERGQEALTLLASDVDRFERMVQDLLAISQADAQPAQSSATPVNMANLTREVADSLGAGPALCEPDDPTDTLVLGDPRRLTQVVDNLIRNAQKYADGVTEILIETLPGDDSAVRVVVEDRGPGVPPSERERIFERFARGTAGRRAGDRPGAGLGLALVAEHVRTHGGKAWVEPRRDGKGGARFVVELPHYPSMSADA